MNTELLTIGWVLPQTGTVSAPSGRKDSESKKFSLDVDDTRPDVKTDEAVSTDNKVVNSPEKPVSNQNSDKTKETKTSDKAPVETKNPENKKDCENTSQVDVAGMKKDENQDIQSDMISAAALLINLPQVDSIIVKTNQQDLSIDSLQLSEKSFENPNITSENIIQSIPGKIEGKTDQPTNSEMPEAITADNKGAILNITTGKVNINLESAVEQLQKQSIDGSAVNYDEIKTDPGLSNKLFDSLNHTELNKTNINTEAQSLINVMMGKKEIENTNIPDSQDKSDGIKLFSDSIGFSSEQQPPGINVQNTEILQNNTADVITDNKISNDMPSEMSKQILESIQSAISQQGQSKELTIRLNPSELGSVCIKFQENQAELTGLLEVSKSQTRTEIEQALPQIIRNLADTGIDVKKIEVVLNDNFQSYQQTEGN